MSLADACLVRLSEIHMAAEVLTLDSDFRIYRRHGNKVIPLRTPAKEGNEFGQCVGVSGSAFTGRNCYASVL